VGKRSAFYYEVDAKQRGNKKAREKVTKRQFQANDVASRAACFSPAVNQLMPLMNLPGSARDRFCHISELKVEIKWK
jgi:hypothetical protein